MERSFTTLQPTINMSEESLNRWRCTQAVYSASNRLHDFKGHPYAHTLLPYHKLEALSWVNITNVLKRPKVSLHSKLLNCG